MNPAGLPRCHRKSGLGFTFLHSFGTERIGARLGSKYSVSWPPAQVPMNCQAQISHSDAHSMIQSPVQSWRQVEHMVPLCYCLWAPASAAEFLTKQLPAINNCRTFHTTPLSNGDYLSQDPTWPYSSLLQVSPGTPTSLMPASTVPTDVYCLCVSYFISTPPSNFQHPSPSRCWAALPSLVGEGAGDLTLLPTFCGRCQAGGAAALVPVHSPHHLFFNVLCNFLPPNFI